jgi:hypothetical protein
MKSCNPVEPQYNNVSYMFIQHGTLILQYKSMDRSVRVYYFRRVQYSCSYIIFHPKTSPAKQITINRINQTEKFTAYMYYV